MAQSRKSLSQTLREALPEIHNFYFSPPNNTQMKYPCVVYSLSGDDTTYADNHPFSRFKEYTVTIIDLDPDSKFSDQLIERVPYCTFDRPSVVDNLNHFIHTLYY